ncbi:helix-turn-helix domain-containing protein [Pseudogracilibacillus sp. SO30301A]|uniref:helix-turn-helix domain-containing protein n=1 Tax=Pseudogracilibacillus sp. SO30301A TaxID=3098291 RepID=UPI00300E0C30
MTQTHSNTKKRNYTHLTDIERGQIAAYLEQELSLRDIAKKMGRDVSTISREKKRGSVQQINTFRKPFTKYFPDVGSCVYEENRRNCGSHSTIMEAWEFIEFAEEKILKEKWSPDAVVGSAKRKEQFEYVPLTKTLYNWIDEGKLTVMNIDLEMKLRRSTKGKKVLHLILQFKKKYKVKQN